MLRRAAFSGLAEGSSKNLAAGAMRLSQVSIDHCRSGVNSCCGAHSGCHPIRRSMSSFPKIKLQQHVKIPVLATGHELSAGFIPSTLNKVALVQCNGISLLITGEKVNRPFDFVASHRGLQVFFRERAFSFGRIPASPARRETFGTDIESMYSTLLTDSCSRGLPQSSNDHYRVHVELIENKTNAGVLALAQTGISFVLSQLSGAPSFVGFEMGVAGRSNSNGDAEVLVNPSSNDLAGMLGNIRVMLGTEGILHFNAEGSGLTTSDIKSALQVAWQTAQPILHALPPPDVATSLHAEQNSDALLSRRDIEEICGQGIYQAILEHGSTPAQLMPALDAILEGALRIAPLTSGPITRSKIAQEFIHVLRLQLVNFVKTEGKRPDGRDLLEPRSQYFDHSAASPAMVSSRGFTSGLTSVTRGSHSDKAQFSDSSINGLKPRSTFYQFESILGNGTSDKKFPFSVSRTDASQSILVRRIMDLVSPTDSSVRCFHANLSVDGGVIPFATESMAIAMAAAGYDIPQHISGNSIAVFNMRDGTTATLCDASAIEEKAADCVINTVSSSENFFYWDYLGQKPVPIREIESIVDRCGSWSSGQVDGDAFRHAQDKAKSMNAGSVSNSSAGKYIHSQDKSQNSGTATKNASHSRNTKSSINNFSSSVDVPERLLGRMIGARGLQLKVLRDVHSVKTDLDKESQQLKVSGADEDVVMTCIDNVKDIMAMVEGETFDGEVLDHTDKSTIFKLDNNAVVGVPYVNGAKGDKHEVRIVSTAGMWLNIQVPTLADPRRMNGTKQGGGRGRHDDASNSKAGRGWSDF